jgi:dihydroorotate dehydrogenase
MMLSLYELTWKPAAAMIRRSDPMVTHARTVSLMRRADACGPLTALARRANRATFPDRPTRVGGVTLPHRVILAAGLVKGDGFAREEEALAAVGEGRDIVPGWRSMAALVGPVELGSFTRHPRLGNRGRVLWRYNKSRTMQNRIGLRNPGARAAATHLARHAASLPPVWGLNLAVSPGVTEVAQSQTEISEAAAFFSEAFAGLETGPAWLTLNLSCPNTEDDPHGTQSAELVRVVCGRLVESAAAPVWVKVGPDLSDKQLASLVDALAEAGARAVVATNTWARAVPKADGMAGVSGAMLRPMALDTVSRLRALIERSGAALDIVACGGILSGADLLAFEAAGARAAMVYSALVFRGPLAAALILREAEQGGRDA